MECINHFSHNHPLSFFQLNDFDDLKPYKCGICGLPILHSPSYTCSVDANCNFFLHKPCAQLPREFYHYGHTDTLRLSSPTFLYECKRCNFELHPLAAKAVEIKSTHISHSSHPLVLFCREFVSRCDVCGEKQEGFFFCCQECDFWVHQDCAILPIIARLRDNPHPYILTYFDPMLDSDYDLLDTGRECSICYAPWRLRYSGVYFCCETGDTAHVTCAKSIMDDLQTSAIEEVIQLPQEDDAFPSLVIRRFTERKPPSISTRQLFYHHKLPLIPVHVSSSSREDLVCDVCVQPIDHMMSSPIYRCQSDACHFVAHNICANHLPTSIQLFDATYMNGDLQIQDSDDYNYNNNFICSVVPCVFCRRPSNGFVYLLSDDDHEYLADIECGFSPKIIKHASHRKHLLYQMMPLPESPITPIPVVSCCSRKTLLLDTYRCAACDFSIHIRCALLPKKTHHKFDDHPLELIMSHEDNKQEPFCEVCEQDIELKYWYYGCHKCEQYFHINCIPSVGYLSKVKFGKTLVHDKIHPNHPLTLTRMLTHGWHERCGHCEKIIQGFAPDEMALHCSDCDFWIHFSCASATTGLLDYSKSLKKLEEEFQEELSYSNRACTFENLFDLLS